MDARWFRKYSDIIKEAEEATDEFKPNKPPGFIPPRDFPPGKPGSRGGNSEEPIGDEEQLDEISPDKAWQAANAAGDQRNSYLDSTADLLTRTRFPELDQERRARRNSPSDRARKWGKKDQKAFDNAKLQHELDVITGDQLYYDLDQRAQRFNNYGDAAYQQELSRRAEQNSGLSNAMKRKARLRAMQARLRDLGK